MRDPRGASTDEALVSDYARSRSGDALDELVRRYWGHAFHLSLRALGDEAAAEDSAQEAFVALMKGAATFDGRRSFGPWFRTLVMNAARKRSRTDLRQRRHTQRLVAKRPAPVEVNEGETRLLAKEAAEQVRSLAFDVRFPILLHFFGGCSLDEVAAVVGCPRSTAQSRIQRGLVQLRESLAEAGLSFAVEQIERALHEGAGDAIPVPPSPGARMLEALLSKASRVLTLDATVKAVGLFALVAAALAGAWIAGLPGRSLGSGSQSLAMGERALAPVDSSPQGDLPGDTAPAPSAATTLPLASTPALSSKGVLVSVTDLAGAPVANLRVVARINPVPELQDTAKHVPELDLPAKFPTGCLASATRIEATTGPDGRVYVSGLPSMVPVVLVAERGLEGAASERLNVPLDGAMSCSLVLRSPERPRAGRGTIVGTVSGSAGPLALTRVGGTFGSETPTGLVHGPWLVEVDVTTDERGRFAIHDVLPGLHAFRLRQGEEVQEEPVTALVEEGRVAEVALRLVPGARLTGRVVAGEGASAPKDVVVLLTQQGRRQWLKCDSTGVFQFTGLECRNYVLSAWADGFAIPAVQVPVESLGALTAPDLVLGRGAIVTGRVVCARGPLADRVVLATDTRAESLGFAFTGGDGAFRIAGLEAGRAHLVVLSREAFADVRVNRQRLRRLHPLASIDVPATGSVAVGDLEAPPTDPLSGHVFGLEGRAVRGAVVELVGSGARLSAVTDASGAYSFDVAPGPFTLVARSENLVSAETTGERGPGTAPVVDLTLAEGGSVTGRVTAPAERRGMLHVVALAKGGVGVATGWISSSTSAVGSDGRYLITGLRPGLHRILVAGAGRGQDVNVGAGREETVDFALASGDGRVLVRVEEAGGASDAASGPRLAVAYRGSFDPNELLNEDVAEAPVAGGQALLEQLPEGPLGVALIEFGASSRERRVFLHDGVRVACGPVVEVALSVVSPAQTGEIEGRIDGWVPEARAFMAVVARGDGVMVCAPPGADGRFRLHGVPRGACRVALIREGALAPTDNDGGLSVVVAPGACSGPAVLSMPITPGAGR